MSECCNQFIMEESVDEFEMWQGGAVKSVNGKVGAVVLTSEDVGALPDTYEAPVLSVNEKTGAVVLDAGDIGYDGETTYPDASVGKELTTINSALSSVIHTNITNLGDGYINSTNGEIVPPTGDKQKYTVDFIPVVYGERLVATLHLSSAKYRNININGYDANKMFVARLAINEGGSFSTIVMDKTIDNPSVAFVRYSFNTYDVFSDFSIDAYVSNTQILSAITGTVDSRISPLMSLEQIGYQFIDDSNFALGYYNWNSGQTDIQKNIATQSWYCIAVTGLEAGTYHYNKCFHPNFSFIRNLNTNAVVKMTDAGFVETANGTITINYPFSLYITCHDQLQNINNCMLSSLALPSSYTFGFYKVTEQYVNAQGQAVWVVGNGYIPTIQEACNMASANDIIFIRCGTYTEQVAIWNKKLHLIGEDKANTILIDHSGNYDTPPLEMSLGSLSNMTIIEDGTNPTGTSGDSKYMSAYCLHIEWTPPANEVLKIENCDFIDYVHAPLGCGLYQDYTVHFKNCTFRCEATNEGNKERGSFYFHTNINPNVTGQKIIAENCIISSAGAKWAVLLGVPSGANNTGSGEARFSGCTIWNDNIGTADSIAYFDTSGGADVLKVVHSCGNTVDILNNW